MGAFSPMARNTTPTSPTGARGRALFTGQKIQVGAGEKKAWPGSRGELLRNRISADAAGRGIEGRTRVPAPQGRTM